MSASGDHRSDNVSLDQVPDEVLRLALSRLGTPDLNRTSLVNHRFRNISSALLGRRDDLPRRVQEENVEQRREKSRRFRDWYQTLIKALCNHFMEQVDIFNFPFGSGYFEGKTPFRAWQTRLGIGLRRFVKKHKEIFDREHRLQRTTAAHFTYKMTNNLVFKFYDHDVELAQAPGAPKHVLYEYRGKSSKPSEFSESLLHYSCLKVDDGNTQYFIKRILQDRNEPSYGGKLSGFTLAEHLFYQTCAKRILDDFFQNEGMNVLDHYQWQHHALGSVNIPYESEIPDKDPTDIDNLLANYAENNRIELLY